MALFAAVAAAAAVTLPAAITPWQRGRYAVLSFSPAGAYTFNYSSGTTFSSTPGSLENVTAGSQTAGLTDPALGMYDELNLTVRGGGSLSVRYFPSMDAFVFVRAPPSVDPESPSSTGDSSFPTTWPSFSIVGHNASATRCLGWNDHYFFPGGISTSLLGCKSNGPLFLFEAPSYEIPPPPSAAMVLSALSHFTSNQVVNCPSTRGHTNDSSLCALGVSGAVGQCKRCARYSTSALMLARPSLQRSIRAFGSAVRQAHNTTRLRGSGVNQLSAWNDNQAACECCCPHPRYPSRVHGALTMAVLTKLLAEFTSAGFAVCAQTAGGRWAQTRRCGASPRTST